MNRTALPSLVKHDKDGAYPQTMMKAEKKAMSLFKYMDRPSGSFVTQFEEPLERRWTIVKSFHYLDDYRYAVHFVKYHHEQRSRQRLRQDLYGGHVRKEGLY